MVMEGEEIASAQDIGPRNDMVMEGEEIASAQDIGPRNDMVMEGEEIASAQDIGPRNDMVIEGEGSAFPGTSCRSSLPQIRCYGRIRIAPSGIDIFARHGYACRQRP
jgi:hypothetical protein